MTRMEIISKLQNGEITVAQATVTFEESQKITKGESLMAKDQFKEERMKI
jgi:hypothetical protein